MSGEILSDDEKEALLDGVSSGVLGESKDNDTAHQVKRYEILPENYINYGSYPRLQSINQQFAKRIAASWSTLLRNEVSVTAEDSFTTNYAQVSASMPAPVVCTLVELKPLPFHALIMLENALLAGLVESFFGCEADEDGKMPTLATVRHDFTSGELRVSELAIERLLAVMPAAWEKLLALQPNVRTREFDPTVGVGIEPKEQVIVSSFMVQTATRQAAFKLVMPVRQIASIADELEGSQHARSEGDPRWREAIGSGLQDVRVPTDVLIGNVSLALRKIIALKPGDTLPLDTPQAARLTVNGKVRATGQFGQQSDFNAFRLEQWAELEKQNS